MVARCTAPTAAPPVFESCSFTGNATGGHGGALFSVSRTSQLEYAGAELTSSERDSNTAAGDGGAIDATGFTRITLTGCSLLAIRPDAAAMTS